MAGPGGQVGAEWLAGVDGPELLDELEVRSARSALGW
jgi:hypothetical protein